ncbi:30S ribosome-binding factor RbfA [Nitrospira sp. Kam-Ns4a]
MAKTGYKRATRVADQVRIEIADILMRKSKDPRLGFLTVTDVVLTDDLRIARVYITTLQEGPEAAQTFARLERAKGFIRSELGRRLKLRYTPELTFYQDTSGARADRVLALIESVRPADESEGPAPSTDAAEAAG